MVIVNKPLQLLIEEIAPIESTKNLMFRTNAEKRAEILSSLRREAVNLGVQPNPLLYAVENVFDHAHVCHEENFLVDWLYSRRGVIFVVFDSGPGFDFQRVQGLYIARKKYFKQAGVGFKEFNSQDIEVSFSEEGRQVNILYPRNPPN
jgi:hypothetical protein